MGVTAAALGYQYLLRLAAASTRTNAYVPEGGRFAPRAITVVTNEPVTLRFASMDVTHGIAIGPKLDVDLGHVDPGQVKEITLTFDHPGTYTCYCNAWCSPDHWQMRSTIQVIDPEMEITRPPSAQRGADLFASVTIPDNVGDSL